MTIITARTLFGEEDTLQENCHDNLIGRFR